VEGYNADESNYPPPNAEDFEARAWDAQGREVAGVSLYLRGMVAMSAGTEVDSGMYVVFVSIFLPGTAGFTRVALEENGTLVHEWTAGARAPVIESLTMTDGPNGPLIEWAASDPDGDDLTYMVWLVDATGDRQMLNFDSTTETSMLVDWNWSHGPGPHRAVVEVTDGINTSWAVTDPVETANQPPYFLWDDDGTQYATDEGTFRLQLWVQDPEGEQLGSQIVWTSSIDGYLTTGNSLDIFNGSVYDGPAVSVGTHQITASVTDSGGASGSIVFTLVVGP